MISRRNFLLGAGLLGGTGYALTRRFAQPAVPVEVQFPGMRDGHLLRDARALPPPRGEQRIGIAILGSGVAGMSCAWALARAGRTDFVLLQGPEYAGNAAGANLAMPGDDDLRCPLGAHYLPLPSTESMHMRALLADLGVLQGGAGTLTPTYDEAALAHAPHARLLVDGRWRADMLPPAHDPHEQAQQDRFFAEVARLRTQRGSDGRRLFAIPAVLSSQDPQWRALDTLTFAQWLDREGYVASGLRWYLDYCCRDDYGAGTQVVSAWAGLHYFASRDGKAGNASSDTVLTWPGGLSELIARMRNAITHRLGHARWLQPGFAAQLREQGDEVQVLVACQQQGALETRSLRASRVVSAMPLHVLAHVWPGLRDAGYDTTRDASPHAAWLVSNFLLQGWPDERPGEALAWDNVVHRGKALGYVVSTHQLLRVAPTARTVFTAYQSLDAMDPRQARAWLLQAPPQALRAQAATDLEQAYGAELWRHVRQLQIAVRGHAMAIPVPGLLDSRPLQALRALDGRVLLAHSDLSGYSVFEEAAWWGVQAAARLA